MNVGVAARTALARATVTLCSTGDELVKAIVTVPAFALSSLLSKLSRPPGLAASLSGVAAPDFAGAAAAPVDVGAEEVAAGAEAGAVAAGTDGFGATGSGLLAAFAVGEEPEVITAVDMAVSTSTTEIAITVRSPAWLPGNSGRRRPSASDTIRAHATSTPPAM